MKKRFLSMILTLCLVLTAIPAGFAYGASEPTEKELKEIFADISFAATLHGGNPDFDEDEPVAPGLAFWYLSMNDRLSKYYNDESWCYELTISKYLAEVEDAFTNYNEAAIKEWLTKNGYYDASAGNEVKIFVGGMGDVWAWEPLEIRKDGSTYYIDGLFLYGNDETGDVQKDDVEFYDYWMYTSTWTDENGKQQSATYPMHIENGITVTVKNTANGLKVAAYDNTSCYTYKGTAYVQNPVTKEFDQSYTAKLGYKSTTYSGSAKKPSVTVVDKKGRELAETSYLAEYSNNKNPGVANIRVKVIDGDYACQIRTTFNIKLKTPAPKAAAIASSGKIKVSWPSVYKADKYEVYRATSKNGKYSKVKTTTLKYYNDTKATAEKTYYYKVKAIKSGNSAINSAQSKVISKVCDLAKPTITVKRNSNGDPKVSWKKVSYADKYYVYRATKKSGTYSKVKTTTSLSYTDTKAKAGKTYYYKVKAVSTKTSDANSAYSEIKNCKAN